MALMDKFDQIGKKAREAAQLAKEKSSQLVETSKLNAQVSDKEDDTRDLYMELGRVCYQLYNNNVFLPNEAETICMQIKELKDEINSLQREISDLKNLVICPQCGEKYSRETAYCSECGAKLNRDDEQD